MAKDPKTAGKGTFLGSKRGENGQKWGRLRGENRKCRDEIYFGRPRKHGQFWAKKRQNQRILRWFGPVFQILAKIGRTEKGGGEKLTNARTRRLAERRAKKGRERSELDEMKMS